MAELSEPESGRQMSVWSDLPGIQVYTANFLNDSFIGKKGRPFFKHQAICLEPQYFPDSPNHTDFPSTKLCPGEKYKHQIKFQFEISDA